jgi:hypothetical protein
MRGCEEGLTVGRILLQYFSDLRHITVHEHTMVVTLMCMNKYVTQTTEHNVPGHTFTINLLGHILREQAIAVYHTPVPNIVHTTSFPYM